jgi:hypothetical protein
MRRCGKTKLAAGVTPTGEGGRDNGRCWCSPPPVLEDNFFLFQSTLKEDVSRSSIVE